MQSSVKKTMNQSTILSAIDSVMILCGSVMTTPLAKRIGRSLVDLPLPDGTTISSRHFEEVLAFKRAQGLENLRLRMIYAKDGQPPHEIAGANSEGCSIEQDPSPIRGVAGLLADSTKDLDDDQYIVVANGALVFVEPFAELVVSMASTESDVSFVASSDGSPVGIWLIRCGVLRAINPVGYIDLKEQALEMWRDTYRVRVVQRPHAYSLTTRSLPEYLDALHAVTRGYTHGSSLDEDPYREEWEASFGLQEPGAEVDSGATLHDAVALAGSRVGKGAVVVRSVLCDGAVVDPGAIVADKVVTGRIKKGRGR